MLPSLYPASRMSTSSGLGNACDVGNRQVTGCKDAGLSSAKRNHCQPKSLNCDVSHIDVVGVIASAMDPVMPESDGDAWLSQLRSVLVSERGRAACSNITGCDSGTAQSIRPAVVMDVAVAEARAAARAECISPEAVAREVGCTPRTVRLARNVFARLGITGDRRRRVAKRRYYCPKVRPRDARRRGPVRKTGCSWRPEAKKPLTPVTPVWWGKTRWLNALGKALESERGRAACSNIAGPNSRRPQSIRPATVMDVAVIEARTADHATGRNVCTSNKTVADILGCCPRTVQRARGVINRLGFAIVVDRGRYLTRDERTAAFEIHGRRQVRCASERALIMPKPMTSENKKVRLPRSGVEVSKETSRFITQAPASRAAGNQAMKQGPQKSAETPSKPRRRSSQRFDLATKKLAAGLAARLQVLCQGKHIGSLCRILAHHGMNSDGWTPGDVLRLIEDRNKERGLYTLAFANQRDPLGLFAYALADAHELFDLGNCEAPIQRRARLAAEQRTRQAARAAQAKTEREQHVPVTQASAPVRQDWENLRKQLRSRSRAGAYRAARDRARTERAN